MALETLGGVSAIITVVELTARIVERSLILHQKLKDGPAELRGLSHRIELMRTFGDELQSLRIESTSPAIPDHVINSLHLALRNIEHCIDGLLHECRKLPSPTSRRVVLQWMLLHAASVKQYEDQLTANEMHLSVLMSFLLRYDSLDAISRQWIMTDLFRRYAKMSLDNDSTILGSVRDTLDTVKALQSIVSATTPPSVSVVNSTSGTQAPSTKRYAPPSGYGSWSSTVGAWLYFCGVQASIISIRRTGSSTVTLNVKFHLSSTGKRKPWVLHSTLVLTITSFFWPSISKDLSLLRLVPEEAEIMCACRGGDLIKVQMLLVSGMASPFDVTPTNRTPLDVSGPKRVDGNVTDKNC